MKEFIEEIVSSIVPAGQFQVKEDEQDGSFVYTILVSEEDIGKIIGKEGKVINSIRCLCRVKSLKNKQRVFIKVDKILPSEN